MEFTIEIPEKDLLAFGAESVREEIARALRWLKIRQAFRKISAALKPYEQDYAQELETIREAAWDEYKIGLA